MYHTISVPKCTFAGPQYHGYPIIMSPIPQAWMAWTLQIIYAYTLHSNAYHSRLSARLSFQILTIIFHMPKNYKYTTGIEVCVLQRSSEIVWECVKGNLALFLSCALQLISHICNHCWLQTLVLRFRCVFPTFSCRHGNQ